MLLGLALPTLVLTHREAVGAGVRSLLRDCMRLPRSWWWLPLAGFGLPIVTWTTGAALGGAQPLTWDLAAFYVFDLLVNARRHQHLGRDGLDRLLPAPRGVPVGSGRRRLGHLGLLHRHSCPASPRRRERSAGEIGGNLILLAGVATACDCSSPGWIPGAGQPADHRPSSLLLRRQVVGVPQRLAATITTQRGRTTPDHDRSLVGLASGLSALGVLQPATPVEARLVGSIPAEAPFGE